MMKILFQLQCQKQNKTSGSSAYVTLLYLGYPPSQTKNNVNKLKLLEARYQVNHDKHNFKPGVVDDTCS